MLDSKGLGQKLILNSSDSHSVLANKFGNNSQRIFQNVFIFHMYYHVCHHH